MMIDITVRRERKAPHTPVIFFYEDDELTCYAHVGQHSAATIVYMRDYTRRVDEMGQDYAASALVREWGNQPPKIEFRIVQRLKRPK